MISIRNGTKNEGVRRVKKKVFFVLVSVWTPEGPTTLSIRHFVECAAKTSWESGDVFKPRPSLFL